MAGSGILSHSVHNYSPFWNHGTADSERSTSLHADLGDMPLTSNFEYRSQSTLFYDDDEPYDVNAINQLLRNLLSRTIEVTDALAEALFPDEAFGFPINSRFISNFQGSFLNASGYLDPKNFCSDIAISTFLNRMVSTIAKFLRSTEQTPLENLQPLRYFSSLHSQKPLKGSDMILVRLIDGCTREGTLGWKDLQALVEHTTELKPPGQMAEMVIAKDYLTFCAQPERNFLINLCITGEGFHIVIADHTGLLETDVIPFDRTTSISIFIRMVMGLAFLPDNFLGIDETIIRREVGRSSGMKFDAIFSPFTYAIPKPFIPLLSSSACHLSTAKPLAVEKSTAQNGASDITTISINSQVYPVVKVIFSAKSLIGRATKVFLVKLPDDSIGVIKDSWMTTDRPHEATFLEGVSFPFCPTLIDHSVLQNTSTLRSLAVEPSLVKEIREKRRTLMRPAGVPASDFSSLWELMVAFLDIAVAIMYLQAQHQVHRDISYTNILLHESGGDAKEIQDAREKLMEALGLSEIEELRQNLNCRDGLLIDFDCASDLQEETTPDPGNQEEKSAEHEADATTKPCERVSGIQTGTPPFMAIELLIFGVPHRVVHDLESLFFVLLFICTHLNGPHNTVGSPPLFGRNGDEAHPSPLKAWLSMKNFRDLGYLKYGSMIGNFEGGVLPHISPYFWPLRPHLTSLWHVLYPKKFAGPIQSLASPLDIIRVFKNALLDNNLIELARNNGSSLGNRW